MNQISVINQFKAVRQFPLVGVWGAIMGMAIPISVFWLSHSQQVLINPRLWILVYAGLAFSGLTVCAAMYRIASGNTLFRGIKAFAFTVLLEGTMTFATDSRLTSGMLILLIALNALEFAYTMVSRHIDHEAEQNATIAEAVTVALDSYKAELEQKRQTIAAKRAQSKAQKPAKTNKKRKAVKTETTAEADLIHQKEFDIESEIQAQV